MKLVLLVGVALALVACAAPVGTKAVNPACVVHCTVQQVEELP